MSSIIHLYSGKRFDLLNPHAADVDIESIAHGLSQIVRWTGQCEGPFTVAQHVCLCCDIAPPSLKLSTLCHDNAEALLGDCSHPLKVLLPQYVAIEKQVDQLLCAKFGVPYPHPGAVKEIDIRMQATEMRAFIKGNDWRNYSLPPYDITIKVWTHKRAEREFLARFRQLFSKRS